MAKRLHMTNADYVAIAISPAMIMALVGSLVFFLIEVLYVGQYQARLNYAFALFVFAAVLIARISIEMGSERAALFALALGVVMFLFMMRFVEHPSALSHLINLALLAVVWWCAHQLTWDSTVIDDDEDASGEGLMQRIGVDGPEPNAHDESAQNSATADTRGNELVSPPDSTTAQGRSWWQRLLAGHRGPHTPGVWVFYFSLAALPLFGIGQHWIPAADVGRRRYVFVLLLVYVAAALALLVTTSFLNLRRYLRQRRIEMPLPIAGTWVGVGAVLIAVVMLLAALIPRPGAEIALSRVPWQAGSPQHLAASRTNVNSDGGEEQAPDNAAVGETESSDGEIATQRPDGGQSETDSNPTDDRGDSSVQSDGGASASAESEASDGQASNEAGTGSDTSQRDAEKTRDDNRESSQVESENSFTASESEQSRQAEMEVPRDSGETSSEPTEPADQSQSPSTPQSPPAIETIQSLASSIGGLAGILKLVFYGIVALLLAYFAWKYRHAILQAIADILRQLRLLFGGQPAASAVEEQLAAATRAHRSTFADFRDPFATGQHSKLPPEELVRYTFAAFEAWANDRGRPRTPDCTPQELVALALDPENPLYAPARRLVRLYSEVAYASRRLPRESVNDLREFWQMMRSAHTNEQATAVHH